VWEAGVQGMVKIRAKSIEVWAKCVTSFAKSLYLL